ncbi:Lrp/AsnC family transcriptional regulator, partial [Rhizobium ruizarguesonis]
GLGLTVFVEFKVFQHSRENSEAQQNALLAIPEIVSCFLISGTADFLAEVVVEDLAAYERLLTETLLTLPNVSDIPRETSTAHASSCCGWRSSSG